MDNINELKAKLAALNQKDIVNKSTVWGILDDKTKDLSGQEIEAINLNKNVNTAKDEMFKVFIEYFMFPKFRDEFASIPAFRPLCDKYIGAVLEAKSERFKRANELEEENARLKAEIEAMRGGK